MKRRLNLTIDAALMEKVKRYADKNQTPLSQLVEHYFTKLIRPASKKNILNLLKELPKKGKSFEGDLQENYYQQQKKKYGF